MDGTIIRNSGHSLLAAYYVTIELGVTLHIRTIQDVPSASPRLDLPLEAPAEDEGVIIAYLSGSVSTTNCCKYTIRDRVSDRTVFPGSVPCYRGFGGS